MLNMIEQEEAIAKIKIKKACVGDLVILKFLRGNEKEVVLHILNGAWKKKAMSKDWENNFYNANFQNGTTKRLRLLQCHLRIIGCA